AAWASRGELVLAARFRTWGGGRRLQEGRGMALAALGVAQHRRGALLDRGLLRLARRHRLALGTLLAPLEVVAAFLAGPLVAGTFLAGTLVAGALFTAALF